MTSCQNQVGITEESHISTKVLAPPGGKTSISLFGGNDAAPEPSAPQKQVNRCQAARNKSNVFGGSDAPVSSALPQHHKDSQQRRQASSVFGESSQPAPVTKPFEPEPRKPHVVNPHQEARQSSSLFKEPTQPAKPPPARKGSDIIGGQGPNSEEASHTSVKIHAPPGGVSHISFG